MLAFVAPLSLFRSSGQSLSIYATCTSSSYGGVVTGGTEIDCSVSSHSGDTILVLFTSHSTSSCPTLTATGLTYLNSVCIVSENTVSISSSLAYYYVAKVTGTTQINLTNSVTSSEGFVAFDLVGSYAGISSRALGGNTVCGCDLSIGTIETYSFASMAAWINTNASATWSYSTGYTASASSAVAAQEQGQTVGYSTSQLVYNNISAGIIAPTYYAWSGLIISFGGSGGCLPLGYYYCSTETNSYVTTSTTVIDGTTYTQTGTTTNTTVHTSVGYSVSTVTTSTTITTYRINAPNPAQVTYWIFPIIFIGLGEALTIAFVTFGSRSGRIVIDQKTMLISLMIGGGIGTMLGTGAGIVNFMFPVLFFTGAGLYAWATR